MVPAEHSSMYEIQDENVSVDEVMKNCLERFNLKEFLGERTWNLMNLLFYRNAYDTI